ncbi:MAG: hypothetical protein AAFX86_07085 [Pseudomonadota bacterium]
MQSLPLCLAVLPWWFLNYGIELQRQHPRMCISFSGLIVSRNILSSKVLYSLISAALGMSVVGACSDQVDEGQRNDRAANGQYPGYDRRVLAHEESRWIHYIHGDSIASSRISIEGFRVVEFAQRDQNVLLTLHRTLDGDGSHLAWCALSAGECQLYHLGGDTNGDVLPLDDAYVLFLDVDTSSPRLKKGVAPVRNPDTGLLFSRPVLVQHGVSTVEQLNLCSADAGYHVFGGRVYSSQASGSQAKVEVFGDVYYVAEDGATEAVFLGPTLKDIDAPISFFAEISVHRHSESLFCYQLQMVPRSLRLDRGVAPLLPGDFGEDTTCELINSSDREPHERFLKCGDDYHVCVQATGVVAPSVECRAAEVRELELVVRIENARQR